MIFSATKAIGIKYQVSNLYLKFDIYNQNNQILTSQIIFLNSFLSTDALYTLNRMATKHSPIRRQLKTDDKRQQKGFICRLIIVTSQARH